jgi:archaemetzincin
MEQPAGRARSQSGVAPGSGLIAAIAFALIACNPACGGRVAESDRSAALAETIGVNVTHSRGLLVAFQPLGEVDSAVIACAVSGIAEAYDSSIIARAIVLPRAGLPSSAYYRPGGRYRAEKLLDYLNDSTDTRFDRVVGLTMQDISTTKGEYDDWGIFGLGSLAGRACVISTHRLGRGKVSEDRFRERFVKVVNHEIGHTLGLDHCPTPGCLMEDAEGTIKTVDQESGEPCEACRRKMVVQR